MADSKLSELALATGAGPADLLYVVQGGISKRISVSSLVNTMSTSFTTKLVLPVMASTSTAVATTGSTIINSTLNKIQWYNGATWNTI
jgi:hypothetical protein